jgi:hypothetical protein
MICVVPSKKSVSSVAGNHFARVLTAIFPYALSILLPQNTPKNTENQNGMVVADSDYDCFCTNDKNLGVVNKRRRTKCFGRFL